VSSGADGRGDAVLGGARGVQWADGARGRAGGVGGAGRAAFGGLEQRPRRSASGRGRGPGGEPLVGDELTAATVTTATAAALVACVPLSLACGERAGLTHLAAVASAWGYNLGLKATPLSVAPYAVSFSLLPTFVVRGLPGAPAPPWWLPAAAALLGAGAHFANVLPDLDVDARTGVRGLPQRLGTTGSRRSAAVLLAAGSAVAALGPARPRGLRVGVLAAVGVLTGVGLRRDDRTAFRTAMAVAAVDVALVVTGTRRG